MNFGVHTTSEEVLRGADLASRHVLVTGAASGLGLETARALAAHGAHVTMAVRDRSKADAALESVRAAAAAPAAIDLSEIDLGSLASIRAQTAQWLEEKKRFNVIVANAGVMACPPGRTQDGFEMQFGINHLGHFLLVNRLMPLLIANAPARIVFVTSGAHRRADVDLDDPDFARTPYDPWVAYGRSKTANALMAVAFDARFRDRNVRACAASPGAVLETKLTRHLSRETLGRMASGSGRRPTLKTLAEGAATQVWAAVVADADTIGGRYCENCGIAQTVNDPVLTDGVLPYAVDPIRADALWALSEKLVGESFPAPIRR